MIFRYLIILKELLFLERDIKERVDNKVILIEVLLMEKEILIIILIRPPSCHSFIRESRISFSPVTNNCCYNFNLKLLEETITKVK